VLPIALVVVAAVFALLLLGRIGGSRRTQIFPRWPAIVFAGAAAFALFKGAVGPAIGLACLAALSWVVAPYITDPAPAAPPNPADVEARRVLGVGADATGSEIRTAYRTKMAAAHPDRGGSHDQAARLTAARDRLLKKR
jgi:hypothetical protein